VPTFICLLALVLQRRQKFYHSHFLSHHKREEALHTILIGALEYKKGYSGEVGWALRKAE